MRRRMASRCGAILGASHRMVTSTLPMRAAAARTRRRASARKRCEGAPFQRGSRVGEVLADVAVADGAEQGVGQGVQGDVGVGVAFERVGVGDAARRTARRGRRGRGGARRSLRRCARRGAAPAVRSAMARSSAVVSLTVGLAAHDQRDRQPGPFGDRGVVGQIGACRPPRRRRGRPGSRRKRKPCGVCARHSPARSSVAAIRLSAPARLRVSATGTAAMAPARRQAPRARGR